LQTGARWETRKTVTRLFYVALSRIRGDSEGLSRGEDATSKRVVEDYRPNSVPKGAVPLFGEGRGAESRITQN